MDRWQGTWGPKHHETILASPGCGNVKEDLKSCAEPEYPEISIANNSNPTLERENNFNSVGELSISSSLVTQVSGSNYINLQGGGSEASSCHLPPPTESQSATSSPLSVRRLSAASVASKVSQNRLSGGNFSGLSFKIEENESKIEI